MELALLLGLLFVATIGLACMAGGVLCAFSGEQCMLHDALRAVGASVALAGTRGNAGYPNATNSSTVTQGNAGYPNGKIGSPVRLYRARLTPLSIGYSTFSGKIATTLRASFSHPPTAPAMHLPCMCKGFPATSLSPYRAATAGPRLQSPHLKA